MLVLEKTVKVLSVYKGKSKYNIWSSMRVGDTLTFKLLIQSIHRGQSGLYATNISVERISNQDGLTSIVKDRFSVSELNKYLSKFEFEEVKN